ncbi:universal stress protein [Streptomyces sp. WAC 00631]|uniref:universal stress protein n=1 Tax=Streptomyces sp. WAC 00631 TaxID=2203201 RepID=UPI000F7AFB8D|nr:universal stress protein [Streptomyces sp. WAC 00631]MCC5033810.1 universal stress protein [Streptomyces sp. WAC 00631]
MELPVVVGVDGSEHSLAALDWAVDEAARHGAALRIVHASLWGAYEGSESAAGTARFAEPLPVEKILGAAEERARKREPRLVVTTEAVPDDPAAALVREGRNASLLVTGSRGRGAISGLLLGSVGLAVAARSDCPVVVVRGTDHGPAASGGRVVLGAGDETDGATAARFALREAEARGAGLTAVRAWRRPHEPMRHPLLTGNPGQAEEEQAEWILEELLREPRRDHPGVEVTHEIVEGPARKVLLDASRTAGLLVVGARRREGHLGLQLGIVNHAVLHHAACPVAVVPERH